MADLIAQGAGPEDRWRRKLVEGEPIVVGRGAGNWQVPWDERISRRHAELEWRGGVLYVRRVAQARNPIFVRGREVAACHLRPGEHFVIGHTTFSVTDERADVSLDAPRPAAEQAFSPEHLHQLRFRDAEQRVEVLGRLPELILGAAGEEELHARLVNLLLHGLPRAAAVALVDAPAAVESAQSRARVLQWDRRQSWGGVFQPSERLILEALARRQSILHIWPAKVAREASPFTQQAEFDWAFCTPLPGDACRTEALYVAGRFAGEAGAGGDAADLRDELKFTELVAAIYSALAQLRQLQRQRSGLSQFFAPAVMAALAGEDSEDVLAPREADVSVLFCDLRGFSRESERHGGSLIGLLERVSKALGAMTHHILAQGGVVGDFHGDAAMGFWGWPLGQPNTIEQACRAALAIRAEFQAAAERPGDPLAGFRVGIGIATGRAVAGRIGTVDQVKVTVFGPVVNLASRLEGMTKMLRAPILLDGPTAECVRARVLREVARCRRLAVVKPYGLDTPVEVTELLPPEAECPEVSDAHLADYEAAVAAFCAGRWPEAVQLLHRVPPDDVVKDFLTAFIVQHNRTPPAGWNGVIPMGMK